MSQNVIIEILIVVFVLARFLARELRERRFVLNRIYALPAVLLLIAIALAAATFFEEPHGVALMLPMLLAAVLVGGGIGYAVAHFTTVRVTADANVLFARGSYATVAIWVFAVAIRFFARFALTGGRPLQFERESFALNAAVVLLLACALFFVRFRLVAAAKRERALGIVSATPAI